MSRFSSKSLSYCRIVLAVSALSTLSLVGCGDDEEEDTVVAPELTDLTANEVLFAEMEVALGKAVEFLFTGGGVVPGAGGGQVLVEGTSFLFQNYSPDGQLEIGGQLDMNILASPVTLKGMLQLSGSFESEVLVDMTIDVSSDPFAYGGTITMDGEIYDVAALSQEVSP